MSFPKLQFRYPWRDYQQGVLEAIDDHLSDDKMHIVDHVLNCGYKDVIVAAFQHKKRVDD